jgi:hypothetical protein
MARGVQWGSLEQAEGPSTVQGGCVIIPGALHLIPRKVGAEELVLECGAEQGAGQAGEQVGMSRGVWGMVQAVAEGGGAGGVHLLSRQRIHQNVSACSCRSPSAGL